MIRDSGWLRYSIWEHSRAVRELYARRCRLEEPEMACHAQAAELLAPLVSSGDTVLDVGCGSGYFFHSLRGRGIPVEYFGIDASPTLIDVGLRYLPARGLPPERLRVLRIEDLDARVDHVVCINVLSNLDNYHRPLERLLRSAGKSVILRESLGDVASCQYVPDRFLDEGVDLNVYVNTYPADEVMSFVRAYGFKVERIVDRHSGGAPEMVIGYPHRWTFLLAERDDPRSPSRS